MMKKVLFLIGSLQGGGAEKVLVDTVNSLDSGKYEITVQTLFDEGVYRAKLPDHVRYRTIVSCRSKLVRRLLGKLLFYFVPLSAAYNCFVKDGYDYEIAFLEGMPTKIISGSTEKKAVKIAWIHTDLCQYPDSWKVYGSERKEGEAYCRFDKVFCVSKAVEQSFLSKCPSVKAEVGTLYNVLDNAAVTEAACEHVSLPATVRPCFISVGRLVKQKGYDRLLRIHKRLIDEGYAHSLLIIGDGALRSELETYIAENDLQDTAHLLGYQSNPYKYIRRADAFVCSSYAEGFSTVVSESVLCGTPVIATDVSGNREPEQAPRCSMVVDNDEQALYEGLRHILEQPALLEEYRKELPGKQVWLTKESLLAALEKAVFEK